LHFSGLAASRVLSKWGKTSSAVINGEAPRSNPNAVIYRGSNTFVPLVRYDKPVAEIKEIAVLGYASLRPEFQISELTGTV
jgi:hypothetical protein